MSRTIIDRLAVATLVIMAWAIGIDMAKAHHLGSHRITATQAQSHTGHCR